MEVVKAFLMTTEVVIISLTCIAVDAEAIPQSIHRDSRSGPRAICVMAIDIEGDVMRTQFVKGSHSGTSEKATAEEKAMLCSLASSIIIFDPNSFHRGGPNPSKKVNKNRIFITFRAKYEDPGKLLMADNYYWNAQLFGKGKCVSKLY